MPTGHPFNVDATVVADLYRSGLSMKQIADRFGCSDTAINKRLKALGIPRRTRSEALGNGRMKRDAQWADATCARCGGTFRVKPHEVKQRIYCSLRCAQKARSENGMPHLRKRVTLTCATCERPFAVLPHQATKRQYCSRACKAYGQHLERRSGQMRTIERIIEALLVGIGKDYDPQWRLGNSGFSADFYLPAFRIAIECDGDYWHSLPTNVRSDLKKERAFKEAGIPVLHLTEAEILADILRIRDRIEQFIELASFRRLVRQ